MRGVHQLLLLLSQGLWCGRGEGGYSGQSSEEGQIKGWGSHCMASAYSCITSFKEIVRCSYKTYRGGYLSSAGLLPSLLPPLQNPSSLL